MHKTIKDYSVV